MTSPEFRIRIGQKYVAHCLLRPDGSPLLTHRLGLAFAFRDEPRAVALADQINSAGLGNCKAHVEPMFALGDAA